MHRFRYRAVGFELSEAIELKHRLAVIVALQIAIFLSALDQTILNIAIPKISTLLEAFDKGAWLITSYLLFATVATPVAGKLSDIYGVKTVIIVATVLFGVTSALCGAAGLLPNLFGLGAMDQLILLRALQGIAGGAMLGLCFVAVGELFPLGQRGKYQGYLAAAFILAAILGPVLGGWLVEQHSWRTIFFINIPPSILATLLFAFAYPKAARDKAQAIIDYPGIFLFVLCIAPLLLASAEIGKTGSMSVPSSVSLAISLGAFVLFILRESSAREPLIPLALFKDSLVSISLLTVFVSGISLFGSMLLLAMMLQSVLGVTAVVSGAWLTPIMFVVGGVSVGSGVFVSRTGRFKMATIAGLLLMLVGTVLLLSVSQTSSPLQLLSSATAGGIGLGILLPIHSILIQNRVKGNVMGVATSMTQFFRSLGGTIGTGLMTALMLSLLKQVPLEQGIHTVLIIYAGALAITIIANCFIDEAPR